MRLLTTADLDCSRSGSFKIVLGARFRFDLRVRAVADGLLWGHHVTPLRWLLTIWAFVGSNLPTRRHYFRFARDSGATEVLQSRP